jgi:hypothetical protein
MSSVRREVRLERGSVRVHSITEALIRYRIEVDQSVFAQRALVLAPAL